MSTAAELIKDDLIEQIVVLIEKRLKGDRAERARAFVRGLYERVPPRDLIEQRPDHLYASAISLLSFIQLRKQGSPSIRVFTPNIDEHGWQTQHTVIELITEDMPFLVDSVLAELSRQQADVQLVIHPVFAVARDAAGELSTVEPYPEKDDGAHEAVMHVRVRGCDQEQRDELERRLHVIIDDVKSAVRDFPRMLEQCSTLVQQLRELPSEAGGKDAEEVANFLEWLNDQHFVFFGSRYLAFEDLKSQQQGDEALSVRPHPHSGLGILADPSRDVFEHYQPARKGELIRILKANERSTIHRPVHFDALLVTDVFSGRGQAAGSTYLFLGLFTLSAYARTTEVIPLLRHKVVRTLERSGLTPGSHDHKALRYILETYPRDELFQIAEDDLLHIAMGILHLQNRQRVALFARRDPFARFVSCLVFVPRDRMDTSLRLKIQGILADAFGGSVAAFYTRLGDEPLARIHLIVKTKQGLPQNLDHTSIERRLLEVTRSWEDRVQSALINDSGEEAGTKRSRRFAAAFPAAYRENYDELTAVHDIDFIEAALERREMTMHLSHKVESDAHELALKVFVVDGEAALSDVIPMLENMGLRVIGEVPYDIRPGGLAQFIRMHDFDLVTEDRVSVDLGEVKDSFIEVFSCVWRGVMGNDGFNKLVLHAGLRARELKLLRAYARYLRQAQSPFSLEYMQQTLKRNPSVTRLLVNLFLTRFDPTAAFDSLAARKESARALHNSVISELDTVSSLDEDRILRAFLGAIEATTRTNFFQTRDDGNAKEYVSFKIDSARIADLPLPRPFREVFVFSPRVEGIHLRFGQVARGGLRWSDRQEDFRTEVLGLVKSQQVKNAVIVPVGSKGGFVVKQPPAPDKGRDAFIAEGVACYRTFISGLLDVTDNRVGAEVHTPENVLAHDQPDPYLVVAADKGTATFSDIANEVSEQYGFWLDDAFASGGSAGYDHKKMGITARGAWESVKRHFRELQKDIQDEPFTCVGVGDMSGDVFGNGMLLSKQTRLIAAFNHLHIFVDPDPDPAKSWQERARLFAMPRSTWADYDRKLISNGGGIFDRKAKSVALTPEMKALVGVEDDQLPPNQLIRAILVCDVELLFFGGIGTYVKARSEGNADVGDRSNDALRINGAELRARVVGEGANLGLTQRGRIEFALSGGRCNTDFIDNSAGVDCSDHEVNIKILLSLVEAGGELTRKQRNDLLSEMTEDVAALVLRDNYLQTQALSATQNLGMRLTDRLSRFMRSLERAGELDCALEALPDEEVLGDRQKRSVGFTRPELCVLLSYAKNSLYPKVLDSSLPDDPFLEADLMEYFPTTLAKRYPEAIRSHRLRREIIATVVTNEIVNRVGISFIHEAAEKSGSPVGDIAKAYVVAREAFGMPGLWHDIEALDNKVGTDLQANLLIESGRSLTSFTLWLLRVHGQHLDLVSSIELYTHGVAELSERLGECLPREACGAIDEQAEALCRAGVPRTLAQRLRSLPFLAPVGDIVQVSQQIGASVNDVASLYFEVGRKLGFTWLRQLAGTLPAQRAWDKQATTAIIDDLYASHRDLVLAVSRCANGKLDPQTLIERWSSDRRPQLMRNAQLLSELRATETPDLAMLAVANRQLKALISG